MQTRQSAICVFTKIVIALIMYAFVGVQVFDEKYNNFMKTNILFFFLTKLFFLCITNHIK